MTRKNNVSSFCIQCEGSLDRCMADCYHVFDMIETVDSWALAELLDRHCAALDKSMPILVEINSGREPNKTGVFPEKVDHFVRGLADLRHIRVQGLMTMGPR